MLRDTALATSGLLVEQVGGPSVRPYQPPGIWDGGHQNSNTRVYVQDHGPALYRRSLYTYLEAHGDHAQHGHLRCASAGCLVHAASTQQHAAAGARHDERCAMAGSGAQTGRAHDAAAAETPARLDYLAQTLLARSWSAQEQTILARMLEDFETTYSRGQCRGQSVGACR